MPNVSQYQSHHQHLGQRKTFLERNIHNEMQRPSPDMILISSLKREKLKIKDEMRLIEIKTH